MDTSQGEAPKLFPAGLTIINPSGQRNRLTLGSATIHIGRQSDNELVLRDNRVSRVHAKIQPVDDHYVIEDLDSRHGLFVNGRRLEGPHTLATADTVTFGFPDGYQLIFSTADQGLAKLADKMADQMAGGAGSNLAKLRALVEVARTLQGAFSIQEVLESVVDAALAVTRSHRGFLLLKTDGAPSYRAADIGSGVPIGGLKVQVARDDCGFPLDQDDLNVPTSLIQQALQSRKDLFSMHFDPSVEGGSSPDVSAALLDLRSVVCVPLVRVRTGNMNETFHGTLSETVGLIYLDSRVDLADLSTGNRELLQTLAMEASTILENARLLEEERGKQRIEEELRIARGIQNSLLPRELPSTGWFRAAGSSVASQQVGGDYYDVLPIRPDCWAVVVADVSGKGVSSALLAALLQGAFLMAADQPAQMEELLSRINQYLYQRTDGEKYATLFYAALSSDGGLHWSNAGHCTPVLLHTDGSMEHLKATSMPLGMLGIARFSVETTNSRPGDKIVIFSDGLTEAHNSAGEFFETGRVLEVLQASAGQDCRQVHAALMEAVRQFTCGMPQADDMTLLVLEYQP
ncbi:MAG: SpoIIE family protein phosphatase [Acidobacteriia bacterium]|nr:SpoIIE family protein phosphatase [Terriglobia bacterium]